jgi:5-formyltetrahydrofolate cyclo-ligase
MPDTQSVKRWRRDKRGELVEARLKAGGEQRKAWNKVITASLSPLLADVGDQAIALYWPFRGEYNCRPLLHELYARGARPALPVVVERNAPLEFWLWWPDMEMERGAFGIPAPKARNAVTPAVVISPLVGFDKAGYRLGNGGGYYDRTLAVLRPKPLVIGVGYEFGKLETVYPQDHDIPMDAIVTEKQVYDFR